MGCEGQTYHERRALGFGTARERLGKDASGNFDDCGLTLRPAVDPVITPEGVVYSREAILEYFLQQKKVHKRKLAAWEAQQQELATKRAEKEAIAAESRLIAFDRKNHMGVSDTSAKNLVEAIEQEVEAMQDTKKGAKSSGNIASNAERLKEMKAFWLPSKTPEAEKTVDKPSSDVMCPCSGKKLRMKDLVLLKFTKVPEGESGRYMDPVTKDTFTNRSKLVCLKPTGDVMLEETYKKLVKPEGNFNGTKIREKDVINLRGGGTGFAQHDGDRTQSKKYFHLGPGSGLADLRGQHQGVPSRGGLVFTN
eukprot:CAMPEP_0117675388 /NCGR_PEP_ID=MMETSP0804-20121206/15577_1 /TAXON_ID=1074897 /ORGANISM="Tetraselmis astigmatica, Strain CCMP880" /LENGTH=307 /DNA_ID=CAMNT_0005484385 /DNA_START=301 /DNA_END=1224 /DNA_ORIENTATION=-